MRAAGFPRSPRLCSWVPSPIMPGWETSRWFFGVLGLSSLLVIMISLDLGWVSTEQNRKSRAVVCVAAIDPQFAADLLDEGRNEFHSQPLAGCRIEPCRQGGPLVADRQGVAFSGIRFERHRDAALAMLEGVRHQLVGDETEGNAGDGRQAHLDS